MAISAFELGFLGRVGALEGAALAAYLATIEAQRAFRPSLMADVADAYLTERELAERRVGASRPATPHRCGASSSPNSASRRASPRQWMCWKRDGLFAAEQALVANRRLQLANTVALYVALGRS